MEPLTGQLSKRIKKNHMKGICLNFNMRKASFLILLMAIMSCSKKGIETNSNVDILPGKITAIEVNPKASLGQEVIVTVHFNGGNDGCARPSHLRAVQDDYQLSFQAFYSYPKEPGICTQAIPRHKLTHTFKPIKKGTYRFFATNDETISAKIEVN